MLVLFVLGQCTCTCVDLCYQFPYNCPQELSGLRDKLSLSVSGVVETDFQAQLDHRLEIAIDELRDKSEADIADYKIQIDSAYKDKVQSVLPTCAYVFDVHRCKSCTCIC